MTLAIKHNIHVKKLFMKPKFYNHALLEPNCDMFDNLKMDDTKSFQPWWEYLNINVSKNILRLIVSTWNNMIVLIPAMRDVSKILSSIKTIIKKKKQLNLVLEHSYSIILTHMTQSCYYLVASSGMFDDHITLT